MVRVFVDGRASTDSLVVERDTDDVVELAEDSDCACEEEDPREDWLTRNESQEGSDMDDVSMAEEEEERDGAGL